MRKNYTLYKRYALAFALFAITAVFVYSCKKDKPLTEAEIKIELIADAKMYFEEEVVNLPKPNNDPNFRHSIPKTPNWDKAIVKKISLGDAVIVPIKFDDKTFSRPAGSNQVNYLDRTSYLIIYKDKKEKMHAEWVTLLPNKPENIASSPFVGVVAIEDWNGNFNRAYAFNGTEKHMPVYISEAVTYSKINYSMSVICIEVEHWGYISWADGAPTPKYLGKEIFCSEDGSGVSGGGGGGGYHPVTEEETDPSDYTSYFIDCNGDVDGTAIIDTNCGCIGGNTGIKSCGDIKDNIKNQCIKNALSLALGKNIVNEIKTLFFNTFGSSKNYNVVFADGSLGTTAKDANTRTVLDPITGITTSTITFNTDVANKRSEQYSVATIYHEMVHAELRKIFPQNAQGKILIPAQHEYMAQTFVDKIKTSLKTIFPNLPDSDAQALSWGGLQQTSFFDLLNDTNKTMVGETLMRYSDKDRFDKLGSYCD